MNRSSLALLASRARRVSGLLLVALVGLQALTETAVAQERKIPFVRISPSDGLPHSAVNAIVQDDLGFMWFGTQDGLARYDGHTFDVFRTDDEDPTTISDNWVWTLLKDSRGRLWIGTNEGGLNLWLPTSKSFRRYLSDEGDQQSLSNNRVRALAEDDTGRIWVGTETGLNVLDPVRQTFSRYLNDPSNPLSLSHNQVRGLIQGQDGSIWVGTNGGGLDRLDPSTGAFTNYRHDPDNPASLSQNRVRTLFQDRTGRFWVGTYEGGLNLFDPQAGSFERFSHSRGDTSTLSDDRVRQVLEDVNGVLWVGTDDGLNEWLPARRRFQRHANNPADPTSLSDNQIMSMHQDAGGVLWIGTQGGINKWNAITGSFPGFLHDPGKPDASLANNTITAFAEDPEGRIWVGTYQGLDLLDRKAGTVRHFTQDQRNPATLRDDRVMSLLTDSSDTLWVGTYEGGLHRFDAATERFTNFRYDPDDPTSLSRDAVTAIFEDSQNVLWVATYGGGLNRFNSERTAFVRYLHDPDNVASIGSNQVLALEETSDGTLWIGTDGGGLNAFNRRTGAFTRYRSNPDKPDSLTTNTVFAVTESRDGSLWLGTQGGGLAKWALEDREANRVKFRNYTAKDGLPNETVFSVLEDEASNLWLSTNDGLIKFDPTTELFRSYDTTHGLLSKEFNFGSYLKTSDGELFFGSNEGFNAFYPASIQANAHMPPVVLTSLLKFNQPFDTDVPVPELDGLELSYRDYVVSFEFAALDFAAPEKNQYSYMLEGFDTSWNNVGNRNRATYTNLDSGDYVFRVRASNNDGLWNETGVSLPIRVVPPPWLSTWAYLLYIATALGVVLALVRAQHRRRQREVEQRKHLEKQVTERTHELAERNSELEEAINKLELASVTDSLTGLRNRRFLINNIDADLALVDRYYEDLKRRPATALEEPQPDSIFVIFDLDGFKQVNDNYGHAAGDRVLLQVKDLLKGACRESDTIIRWGGDEFLIIARRARREAAQELAERLRASVAAHNFDLGLGKHTHLSCSIGFAFYPFLHKFPRALSWEQVNAIADRALYIAKKSNRDAWVGIFEGDNASDVHPSALLQKINHELDALVENGVVSLETSIEDADRLVWAWA